MSDRQTRPRQGSRSFYLPILGLGRWLATAGGMAAGVIHQGVRPLTWRRPVWTEFIRFFDLAASRNLLSVIVAGALVGFALIAQAFYWVNEFGQEELLLDIVAVVVVREIAPLFVGFLSLGHSGLVILSELGEMRRLGQIRTLDAQGIDPFLFLVVPRVLALTISVFCLTIVFVIAAYGFGYLSATVLGVETEPVWQVPIQMLEFLGGSGYAVVPVKTLAIGFTIGIVCCLTALETEPPGASAASLMPRGFIRSVLAIFLVSGLTSVLL
jgi:phospholipid/cholesterol/gamma-HCH transport system permease protein